jgi:hypothetical protein
MTQHTKKRLPMSMPDRATTRPQSSDWLLADVLFLVIVVISCAGRTHFCKGVQIFGGELLIGHF